MRRWSSHPYPYSLILMNVLVAVLCCAVNYPASAQQPEDEEEAGAGRIEYDWMRLCDPATGDIPENIRRRELQFAAASTSPVSVFRNSTAGAQDAGWVSRGPVNIGARTRALGIDVADENIILAGGTSGGMWRSTDRGGSWMRTTMLTEIPGVTCLVQDTRPGRTNTWYYGTGEVTGNTAAYPAWINGWPRPWGDYYGNGIYRSTDNGRTWNILAATATDSTGTLVQPFNFVNRIAIDLSRPAEDVLYAAVAGGIERSSDGGATWSMVLGDFRKGPMSTDVVVTTAGVVYAMLGSRTFSSSGTTAMAGIYRSVDGLHWVNITPGAWRGAYAYTSLAVAPSNENVLYAASEDRVADDVFWKYTFLSGDGSGSGGIFEDRSLNLILSEVGSVIHIKVKPDDENTVFVGGTLLVRSTDGFATPDHTVEITPPHVDQTSLTFLPSNPASMFAGCDGGVFFTENNLQEKVAWTNLNNGYVTTQFYTVAIEHTTPGDPTIVGGLQDNGTNVTSSANADQPWKTLYGADGATCAIADGRTSYYISWQFGHVLRKLLDAQGRETASTRIDPINPTQYIWINPFTLDPNNTDRMYFGGGNALWRHDSLPLIPLGGGSPTSVGWNMLGHTTVSAIGTIIRPSLISAISVSKVPSSRVYYGTNDGQLFRIDDASAADPVPTPIWEAKGFPANAFISSIAIDPANADNVLIAFANYNIQSLFYTSDGGITWRPVGGSLEEYPDGTGSGPSCRSVAIMHSGDDMVYLAGTSTGLYSTTLLNETSTEWKLEGPATIGNNIVNMIDTREIDGMVAVATCGQGVFSGRFAPASSVSEEKTTATRSQSFPNPFSTITEIEFDLTCDGFVSLTIHDMLGREITTLVSEYRASGRHTARWNAADVPSGTYYYRLSSFSQSVLRRLIVTK